MSLHQHDNRHLVVSPTGAVLTSGGSLDIPLDVVAIASKAANKATRRGLQILADFAGIDKDREKLTILAGSKKDTGRFGSGKNSRTVDFTLSDVKKVYISHPKIREQKVDYFRIGWDGVNPDTSFKFFKGQTLEFGIKIGGIAATFFNNADSYVVKQSISIPNVETLVSQCAEIGSICEPEDCRVHTLALVKNLNDYYLPGGQRLNQFLDIYPIFDKVKNPEAVVSYKEYRLKFCGFGGNHEFSEISAQYPGVEITKDDLTGEFVIFQEASKPAPKSYKRSITSIAKGCTDCPEGYEKVKGGYVYAVALEDNGENRKDVVQGLPNAEVDTAVKTGSDFGIGHYVVVLSKKLTQDALSEFIKANPTAVVVSTETKVEDFCTKDCTSEHEWVEGGTFNATTVKYRILIPDDCSGSRLAELQELYPDLTIKLVESKNCVSIFETSVVSTTDYEKGCNPAIVQQVFNSEAPVSKVFNRYWFPVIEDLEKEKVLCGIEIKAKPIVMNPSECTYEELPFVMTSVRIESIWGGRPTYDTMLGVGDLYNTWNVLQLDRAQDLDNLGGNLRQWEQKGVFYFRDHSPYRSVIERELTGTQSRLDGLVQYSDIAVSIDKRNKAGMNEFASNARITYHILVPYGKTDNIQKLFEKLAGAAGVPFEVL